MTMRSRLAQLLRGGSVLAPGAIALLLATPAIAQVFEQSFTRIFENVTLEPGFEQANPAEPVTLRGISGGPRAAQDVTGRLETATGTCAGFIDDQPDHRMELTSFFDYLALQVQSPADTTLVIRGPGGVWCNDDYTTMNPGIAGRWLSGTYEIWVGSYVQNTYHPYVIRLSETR